MKFLCNDFTSASVQRLTLVEYMTPNRKVAFKFHFLSERHAFGNAKGVALNKLNASSGAQSSHFGIRKNRAGNSLKRQALRFAAGFVSST